MSKWTVQRNQAARELGVAGELLASAYLRNKGYALLATNWRPEGIMHGLELDLVARYKKEIVFVEVKTRKGHTPIPVHTAFSLSKQRKMIEASRHYLAVTEAWEATCRFDLICVTICADEEPLIEHYNHVIELGQNFYSGNTSWQPW